MKMLNRGARWAVRAACAVASGLALTACDLGYQGLEPLVDLGNTAGSCAEPVAAVVRGIEVSRGSDDLSARDAGEGFTPLADGDALPIVRGVQGADMVVLVLRVTGVDADRCIPQQTTLVDAGGTPITRLSRPVQFRATAPGMAESRSLYLPGEFVRGPHTLTVTLGGVTLTRRLNVGGAP